jgi:hypothetical protein
MEDGRWKMGEGNAEPKFATADEIGRFSDQLIPEAERPWIA